MKKNLTDVQIVYTVSKNSIIMNTILAVFKMIAGVVANSGAMISDAIHSASDVFSTVIVIIGAKISNKESDEKHQYGYERYECVASIILAIILGATGVGVGIAGYNKLRQAEVTDIVAPGTLALIAAIVSIIVKEAMYWYTRNAAIKINSISLMEDAWHHRSDALSSIGSLIGVAGARMGYKLLDPLASIIICVFIVKVAGEIFVDSIRKMTDESCDKKTVEEMKKIILRIEGVMGIDSIKTRVFGSKIYVDVEIVCDGNLELKYAHDIAENVHISLEENIKGVKHCMVHVNPK